MFPSLPENWMTLALAPVILAVGASVAGWVATRLLHRAIGGVTSRTRSTWDDRLVERKVFGRLALVVPAVIVYLGIGWALGGVNQTVADASPGDVVVVIWITVRRLAAAFIALAVVRAFKAFLDALNEIYIEAYAESKSRPIKGYLQVASLIAYLAAGVVILAILAGRSPVVFLSGLGALAAVLMLVFRDTILSLVASVQIASNDMFRIGDWVSVPQANCDGEVIDIALHTVKVQNWDKTISTIPTHKFVSESFKNWRGMSESGGRRIKRGLRIDMGSVRFLTDDELDTLSRREVLRDYMLARRADIGRYNADRAGGDPAVIPEVRRLTNLGTFRAYVQKYLEAHPQTHKGMTLLVRQLEPGPQGVTIEIYCFSNDTAWANYENFQADIFDHLIAILPDFGLKAYQTPSGSDVSRWLDPGRAPRTAGA
ncbi:MAG: mechanosensitive ion channel [Gemmatimonadetes bacterium]|nr:mechanosensitive ion channel [Gemmatimonadota bacterium]